MGMRRFMTLAEVEAARERWLRRLFRAANAVEVYNKAYKRMAARQAAQAEKAGVPVQKMENIASVELMPEPTDDLSIPAQFLRQKPNEADEKAKADILAQQEAAKKEKTTARIAKLKAGKAGDLKKMPPQGKDALKAIFG